MMKLPQHDRERLMHECAEILSDAMPANRFTELSSLLDDCRSTAELHSDPDLVLALTEPITEPLGCSVAGY
jgi:hypothetical protein